MWEISDKIDKVGMLAFDIYMRNKETLYAQFFQQLGMHQCDFLVIVHQQDGFLASGDGVISNHILNIIFQVGLDGRHAARNQRR